MLEVTSLIQRTTSEWISLCRTLLIGSFVYSQDESSEEFIGEWMKERGNREQIVLATKVCL
jgi:predicted aldo/keto reductase-like oxidoreductase